MNSFRSPSSAMPVSAARDKKRGAGQRHSDEWKLASPKREAIRMAGDHYFFKRWPNVLLLGERRKRGVPQQIPEIGYLMDRSTEQLVHDLRGLVRKNSRKLFGRDDVYLDKMETAVRVADTVFEGLTRRDGVTPAVNHPLAVALTLALMGADTKTVLGALLHDIIEETRGFERPIARGDLATLFGEPIAEIVDVLTRREGETYPQYIKRLYESGNLRAMLIKMVDTYCNLATLKHLPPDASRPDFALETLEKAMMHARVVRKFSRPLFRRMARLIIEHAPESARPGVTAKLEYKSDSQKRFENLRWVEIGSRDEMLNVGMLNMLPDVHPGIVVYGESVVSDDQDSLEIELLEFYDPKKAARALAECFKTLNLRFTEEESRLPGFSTGLIFKVQVPYSDRGLFLVGVSWLAEILYPTGRIPPLIEGYGDAGNGKKNGRHYDPELHIEFDDDA